MSTRPLCFVVMPFGQKDDPSGGPPIDFDRIYQDGLAPAIEDAGMDPIRADAERTGGVIHKPMFERLLLCDYAVADLTTANANVFYELGVRHTARPATTLTIFAEHQPIPFDVNLLRSLPYALGSGNSFGDGEARALREAVARRLGELRDVATEVDAVDSPLFQLLAEWEPADIARLKTDVFRDRVQLDEERKRTLAAIRAKGRDAERRADALAELAAERDALRPFDAVEVGTLVDLYLSFRALGDWDGMIALHAELPESLKRQVLVREQLAFAHNRRASSSGDPGDRDEALRILHDVEQQQGPSSETCGLIGRIHKDRWQEALRADDRIEAAAQLDEAIDSYRRGFNADPRDAYPGINLVTLLEVRGDATSLEEKEQLVPVVRFAVDRRLAGSEPDYWDHATMLELAVLADDEAGAALQHRRAVGAIRESFEPGTTANNLRMIADAMAERDERRQWLDDIVADLERRAG